MKFRNSATLPENTSGGGIFESRFVTDDLEEIDDEELEESEDVDGAGEPRGAGVLLLSSSRISIRSCKVRIRPRISSFCT